MCVGLIGVGTGAGEGGMDLNLLLSFQITIACMKSLLISAESGSSAKVLDLYSAFLEVVPF